MIKQRISRRTFLKTAGAGAATAVLAACGGAAEAPAVPTTAVEPTAVSAVEPTAVVAPTAAAEPTVAIAATEAPAVATVAATEAPAATTAATGEEVTLSWATYVSGPVDTENAARELIKERFNVNLEMIALERPTWADQINTRVAGGDIPDIISRGSRGEVLTFVEQGVLAEVPYAMVKQHAPNAFAAANDYTTDVWLATTVDGKNYGVPLLQPSQLHPFTDGWRQDWLDKVGITKLPETIAEYEEAFTKFVQDDPDGNGGANTYGLSFRGKDIPTWFPASFFMAHGTVPHMWIRTGDNQVEWGGTNAGAKQTMELLHRWFEAGLIDPEFVTVDNAVLTEKWANGTIGFITVATWYGLIPGGAYYDALISVNPDARVTLAHPVKGPDGDHGYFNWGPITSSVCFGTPMAGDEAKLTRALQMIDGILTDPDFTMQLRYGTEGTQWERNAETNAVLFTEQFASPQNRGALGTEFFTLIPPVPAIQKEFARKDEAELYAKAEEGNVDTFIPYLGNFIPSEAMQAATEINNVQGAAYADFITGARPLEEWDAFVQEWKDAGGEQLTTAANQALGNVETTLNEIETAVTSA